jgi:uncharacterized protein YggE/predicted secreted protein
MLDPFMALSLRLGRLKTRIITTLAVLMMASFALGSVFFAAPSSAAAVDVHRDNMTRSISVTGVSSTQVSPDRVGISFAVESQEKTAGEAAQANAKVTTLVLEAIKEAGLSESEIATSNYNIQPVYEYMEMPAECIEYGEGNAVQKYCPPPALKQVLVGFKAVNGVVVDSSQLDKVGQWIDAAVGAGANRVDYLYFHVSDQRQNEIRNELIAEAVQDARVKATIALEPLGMEIVNVLSLNLDSYPIVYPKRGYEYAPGAPSPATPVIPGIQEVSATIHATFEIDGFSGGAPASTIQTSVNEEFEVTLDSNPSTGFQWRVASIDETIVRLVSDEYVPPESGLVGAAGKQVLTFEAVKEGKTTVELEYVRPWEPQSPASRHSVEVTVSPNS